MSENRGQSRAVHEPAGDKQAQLLRRLGQRSIVFVGLMGAGKTAIGRKVAATLGLPFTDSDHEIETASRMTIPDLFERYGEAEFRALEQRVIARILENGPQVLSTGGGAFMNEQTRAVDRRARRLGLAEGRYRRADGAGFEEAEPAAAQEPGPARRRWSG